VRQVKSACYSHVMPTPVSVPELAGFSKEAAALLDLTESDCLSEWFLEVFSGNRLLPGMAPYAMCYGGHQFGNWAGQLGDGRAINLAEIINKRDQRWIMQLKGAGLTPYSRSADGLAVLRSSLREFICSEAMHHLGIPTTRALSLIVTGESVLRDMFYDGNQKLEPGAVICRLSPSFLRFGNFEILAAQGNVKLLEELVRYAIRTDFPHLANNLDIEGYLQWFTEVCQKTAVMIAHWMRVGFVHGVMNTDNMSTLGLTIDYGPYGWLEGFDPTWTPNTTDALHHRYCYGNQPYVAQWNLLQLANALLPLINDSKALQDALDTYRTTFQHEWRDTLSAKLGFVTTDPDDGKLFNQHLELLTQTETDMTIFYRRLSQVNLAEATDQAWMDLFRDAYYSPDQPGVDYGRQMTDWFAAYLARIGREGVSDEVRRGRMNQVNPKFVFRNYLAQQAIDDATSGNYKPIAELLELFRHPYDEQPDKEEFSGKRPEWARHKPGSSMLSCSS